MKSPEINDLLAAAQKVVIIQADNPDGDSLASSLALEQIIGDMGKEPYMYCGVDMPDYLKHLKGWDRVNKDMPAQFDLSIIVDTSALVLLEKLEQSKYRSWVASRPLIVLDHHSGVKCDIPYATLVVNDDLAVATGEVIYKLTIEHRLPLNLAAKTHIVSSILADSLGLSSEGTTAVTYRIMADLIESGVSRPQLEEARRALSKMPEVIFKYKAKLIQRTELANNGKIAVVTIPDDELKEFSPLYNPAPLIQPDMLQIEGVLVAIVLKNYKDGRVTGSIRTITGAGIAGELAKSFGGGGHIYAAGFKILDSENFGQTKQAVLNKATELLEAMQS